MEAFLIYLVKSAGILLLLFYGCYRLFLSKETLFTSNRWFLISGLVASLFLPFIYRTEIVYLDLTSVVENTPNLENIVLPVKESIITSWSWSGLLLGIYAMGAAFFAFKLLLQIISLKKIIKEGRTVAENNFTYIRSSRNVQPFSFFNYIIYNPLNHNTKDLEFILAHEQVHANQKHSLDILFIEIILLLQWFNPIAWGYKSVLKQNLEFLADAKNEVFKSNKKHYQYILLKQVIGKHNLSIVNPFFNSLIKKRIVMINQMPSQKRNVLKTLIIIPLLVLFLYSFNVKTEYSTANEIITQTDESTIELIIDKNTSDEALLKMKADLKKDEIDFSYTVVRNENGEITSLIVHVVGGIKATGKFNSSYESSSENDTISPTYIFIDINENSISIGNGKKVDFSFNIKPMAGISDDDEADSKKINGKEANEEDLEDMDIHIEGKGFFTGSDKDEPLYIIDGKESNAKALKKLNPDNIASINVTKGKKAAEKYDEKGKNGVIEITTKDEPLYIIDGKESNAKALEKLKPNNIASINVIKGKKATEKYDEKGKNGVIEITTKDEPLYIIDDKESNAKEALKKLKPNNIISITVLKSEQAIKKYGAKGKNGVIEITTKEN